MIRIVVKDRKPVHPVLNSIIKWCFYYFILNVAFIVLATFISFADAILNLNFFHLNFLIPVFPLLVGLFLLTYFFDLIALTILHFRQSIQKPFLMYWRILLVCLIPLLFDILFNLAFQDFNLPL